MKSCIYKILNKIDNKFYIGSAINFEKRWPIHEINLINNKHYNKHLQLAFNKYGPDAFEFQVLEYCKPEKLIEREQFYIDSLKPEYNLRPTAHNQLGFKHSKESILKMKSVIFTDERKKNIADGHTGLIRKPDKWPHGCKCKCNRCTNIRNLEKRKYAKIYRNRAKVEILNGDFHYG